MKIFKKPFHFYSLNLKQEAWNVFHFQTYISKKSFVTIKIKRQYILPEKALYDNNFFQNEKKSGDDWKRKRLFNKSKKWKHDELL